MTRWFPVGLVGLLLVSGCLTDDQASRYQSAIDAQIGISSTVGEAPLRVVVSASESTSSRGEIVRYAWDFAGQATSEEMTAEYTFVSPGRYPITLTVVDAVADEPIAD